jgi:hypothetical protein
MRNRGRTNHVIAVRPTAEASDDVVFDHLRLGTPELEEVSNSRCPRSGVVVAAKVQVDEEVPGERGSEPIASEADAQAARLRHRQAREEDP